MVSSPSLIQWRSDMLKLASPMLMPRYSCHIASKDGPTDVFISTTARMEASSNSAPVDGAQPAKASAAERTRWPSEPSMASEKDASSHGPS